MKTYTLTPGAGSGATERQHVVGFREAIATARAIAERQHCQVFVRNEADQLDWTVAFRVRGTRHGARCVVEVTR